MQKEKYEVPVVEIIEFETDDIITTSAFGDDEVEWQLIYAFMGRQSI